MMEPREAEIRRLREYAEWGGEQSTYAWALAEIGRLSAALERAAYVAEHLHAMIDPQTWRDSGGDDQQGHYEGDYHAENTLVEIRSWKDEALRAGRAGNQEAK